MFPLSEMELQLPKQSKCGNIAFKQPILHSRNANMHLWKELMDWDDLRFVVAVADKGSAVSAAQSLGVNATTVQRRIARFEKTNAVHLFERRQSGLKPTPECEALVEASRPIEESVSAIKREILSRDIRLEGRLLMTTVDTLMDENMAGHLAEFQKTSSKHQG